MGLSAKLRHLRKKTAGNEADGAENKFSKGEIPLPSFWGGYRIIPDTFEFWQGGPGRVHDRFMYKLQENGSWTIERLQP